MRNTLLWIVVLLLNVTLAACVRSLIVNGTEAKRHSRPYMVSIQKNKQHICGGFLVAEQFVMTAAHCYEGRNLTVVMGAHSYKDDSLRMSVKFYHINPAYQPFTNDIMLLQLQSKVKMGKNVKKISLPSRDKDVKPKSKCSIAGWGATTTKGKASDELMEVDVTVIDNKYCQKSWRKVYFPSRMLCSEGPGGFCQGDSGGPLVCKDTAVGIVSFNERNNCESPTFPNVYTKISKYLTWINAILAAVKETEE